jgi:hypothetical protein
MGNSMERIVRRYSSNVCNCTGQSITEFVVLLTFFVPLFLTIPLIGKYLDVKQKTIEASRYAVWERTVWSDVNPSSWWNDDENHKSDEQVQKEIDERIYGNPRIGLHDNMLSDNYFWKNHKGEKILKESKVNNSSSNSQKSIVQINETESPINMIGVDELAYKGVPVLGEITKIASKITNVFGKFIPQCKGAPGIDFDKGMNLGANNYAIANVSAKVHNYTVTGGELTMKARSAILSNAWAAPREAKFRERTDKLVMDEMVSCIATPGAVLFGSFALGDYEPGFGEGRPADNFHEQVDSTVLLPEYKK